MKIQMFGNSEQLLSDGKNYEVIHYNLDLIISLGYRIKSDRIRDIRSSEKVMYRQVLDLYATSVDYDPKSETSILLFKLVQNKLHFEAHGHTAAKVIYNRADAEKPFMGLTTLLGESRTSYRTTTEQVTEQVSKLVVSNRRFKY